MRKHNALEAFSEQFHALPPIIRPGLPLTSYGEDDAVRHDSVNSSFRWFKYWLDLKNIFIASPGHLSGS